MQGGGEDVAVPWHPSPSSVTLLPSMSATSVYVHFPWCLQKCPYCDFASESIRRESIPHTAYADAVIRELEARRASLAGRSLTSIFFGGGTPSLWDSADIARVLSAIRGAFDAISPDLEITAECNPSSLDRRKAASLREAGIGRLSIGVQSLDGDRLRFLGRLHDGDGALRALGEALLEVPRVSADLMFGSPGQGARDFEGELSRVLDTGVKHLSCYALTIEPNTQFGALHRKGRLTLAPEDDYAETFERTHEVLAARGFQHYEVSNYALAGETARHNEHYWRGEPYLGLGAGAVGCLDTSRGHARRYRNHPAPKIYMEQAGKAERTTELQTEALTENELICEALLLGLRTAAGLDVQAVAARTGRHPKEGRERALERRVTRGDVLVDDKTWRIPHARWLQLDSIVGDLF